MAMKPSGKFKESWSTRGLLFSTERIGAQGLAPRLGCAAVYHHPWKCVLGQVFPIFVISVIPD